MFPLLFSKVQNTQNVTVGQLLHSTSPVSSARLLDNYVEQEKVVG